MAIKLTVFAALVLVVALLPHKAVNAAWCNDKSNETGAMNLNPVDTSEPVFVRRVPNGELYHVGNNTDDRISLVHLYGQNGYDWGYAFGLLMGDEAKAVLDGATRYFTEQIERVLNHTASKDLHMKIPKSILDLIAKIGLTAVLDLQNAEAKPFTDPEVYREMQGMADATGMDVNAIIRVHMIGEVTKGDCSFYGAYGKATLGGKTLQLRALDWDTGAGLQNHPVVIIYHPLNNSLGHTFANIGWAGWVGTLTGMSSRKVGISEIGIAYPDDTFGDETFIGIPFIFLERQIVQRAKSVFDAVDMIRDANRTCRLVLGVADGHAKTARLVQYSHSIVRFFNDTDLEPNTWWHPRIEDAVYCGMDWVCPFYQHALYKQLSALHGTLTPELSIMNVTAPVMTGSLHVAVYDLTDLKLFVANARGAQDSPASPKDAYARQFIRFDMKKIFPKPYGQDQH